MGFNAYARVEANLRPKVTRKQVEDACRDFLDWRGYDLLGDDFDLHETGVAYNASTQSFTLQITGECPGGFATDTFQPLVLAIGALAAEPFAATLINEDTSNEDSREFVVQGGPADQLGEFRFRRARYAIEEQLKDIDLPPGTPGASVQELAAQDTMTFSTMAPDEPEEVARVALDLTGLDFDAARRDRIARLATALAREIAGDELRLAARPERRRRSSPKGNRSATPPAAECPGVRRPTPCRLVLAWWRCARSQRRSSQALDRLRRPLSRCARPARRGADPGFAGLHVNCHPLAGHSGGQFQLAQLGLLGNFSPRA